MPTVSCEKLEDLAFRIFCAAGAPGEHSHVVARHLADCNRAGHDSHGFIRVIQYIRQIREGLIVPAAKPSVISDSPALAQVDGNRGFGQVAATFATEMAVEKAKKQGVGCVTVRRLGHLGRLGAYGEMAANSGCAAILFCSTGGQGISVAPYGGSRRKLATNPIAIAFPGEEQTILSDFATSVAAEGKIRVYRARGDKLPDGWIYDPAGRPSTNPNDFYDGGAILPVGGSVGHKGYCLSFMTDLLGGILSRDGLAAIPGPQFSNGSLILVIDLERFAPLLQIRSEASRMVNYIKDTPLAEGFRTILYPGEKEAKNREERNRNGVTIEEDTWTQVLALAREYGLSDTSDSTS
ncbi:MAG TPA: Ldh family oxidoreductase [Thermodesulfobacteriota bacterium]|nr:Ldh family oxidoreductase [Thermodesulfobacteriota bacterium]